MRSAVSVIALMAYTGHGWQLQNAAQALQSTSNESRMKLRSNEQISVKGTFFDPVSVVATLLLAFTEAHAFNPHGPGVNPMSRWQSAIPCQTRSLSKIQLIEGADDRAKSLGSFELELFSPARVNLFLRVLGRRDDGFHDSASLFQAVNLGDRLRLARIPATSFTTAGVVRPSRKSEPIRQNVEFTVSPADLGIPADQTNLVVRALTLFRNKLTERDGGSLDVPRFRAHLVKRLPVDVGLGVAASNAASALFGANELCGRPASADELVQWASELGTDVECFLAGRGSAYCTGRGVFIRGEHVEAVLPLADPSDGTFFIIAPEGLSLSTPAMFRDFAKSQYAGLSTLDPLELRSALTAASELGADSKSFFVNDLEPPALRISAELAKVFNVLQVAGLTVIHMSGSGTALFAFGTPRNESAIFAAHLAKQCTAACGLLVHVWPAGFIRRQKGEWYPDPGV